MKKLLKKGTCLMMLVAMAVLSACGNKEPKTVEEFISIVEEKGYTVMDCTEQFSDYDYVEKAVIALSEDGAYQVEFYDLNDEKGACVFYQENYNILSENEENASSHVSSSIGNAQNYEITGSVGFGFISRIGDTCLYGVVDKEYKDVVKDIKEELGY